jgi:hypothetical protein
MIGVQTVKDLRGSVDAFSGLANGRGLGVWGLMVRRLLCIDNVYVSKVGEAWQLAFTYSEQAIQDIRQLESRRRLLLESRRSAM